MVGALYAMADIFYTKYQKTPEEICFHLAETGVYLFYLKEISKLLVCATV